MPVRTEPVMGTLVTIHIVKPARNAEDAIDRAFTWFHEVESRCTRFEPASELMQLSRRIGTAVPASPILFEAVRFALTVAEETAGAFDPVVGHRMEARGFNREYRTGETSHSPVEAPDDISYRDVRLDPEKHTITLARPLVLDLGAVAKGLAVDAAARELASFRNFAIDAGGDLYMGGRNPEGAKWSVGIRHPRQEGELIATFRVSNQAVCTSGDYERGEHILDPRTGEPAKTVASATVIAESAMLADALATAAFVLGPAEGIRFLQGLGVEGMIVTSTLEIVKTPGLAHAA